MHPLERLEFSTRVAKRAQYEAFEFSLVDGGIRVRNGSHPDPSDHEYRVRVDEGVPATCECPADEQYEGACKHRVAVAIRRPLLDAVTSDSRSVAADGGRVGASGPHSDGPTDGQPAGDDAVSDATAAHCAECLDEFPCWDCVRTGRKELPD
ncbi:SWIM zinc finger family protein [Halosimplex halobium]|uniref:SWIM zinc finger family protein n=1 Tax=Halosimplex halobium TaxID=3396618 RepID=UPI003F5522B9